MMNEKIKKIKEYFKNRKFWKIYFSFRKLEHKDRFLFLNVFSDEDLDTELKIRKLSEWYTSVEEEPLQDVLEEYTKEELEEITAKRKGKLNLDKIYPDY